MGHKGGSVRGSDDPLNVIFGFPKGNSIGGGGNGGVKL